MEIVPVSNTAPTVEHTRHDDQQQPKRRQQERKRERFAPVPVYTLNGGIEEEQPPKIDVLV